MKKLTRMELEAVADKIKNNLDENAKKETKKVKEEQKEQLVLDAKLIYNEIGSLNSLTYEYLSKEISSYAEYEHIFDALQPKQETIKIPWKTEIVNALILAQIEAPDLQTMIDNVTKQFIKED